jgi:hypothetical protein
MPEFHFSVEGADRLASLAGIKSDLDAVLGYCQRMMERYAGQHLKQSPFDIIGFTTHVDFIDWEALSTAACVAYARCFVSGVRQSLDATLLEVAEAGLRDTHEFVMHLRNKHVAHSVNSFEENSVTVHVEDSFQSSTEIRSAIPRHNRQAGLSFEMPGRLERLANWWLVKVREETDLELARVVELARATPLEQIRAFGALKEMSSEDRRSRVGGRRKQP